MDLTRDGYLYRHFGADFNSYENFKQTFRNLSRISSENTPEVYDRSGKVARALAVNEIHNELGRTHGTKSKRLSLAPDCDIKNFVEVDHLPASKHYRTFLDVTAKARSGEKTAYLVLTSPAEGWFRDLSDKPYMTSASEISLYGKSSGFNEALAAPQRQALAMVAPEHVYDTEKFLKAYGKQMTSGGRIAPLNIVTVEHPHASLFAGRETLQDSFRKTADKIKYKGKINFQTFALKGHQLATATAASFASKGFQSFKMLPEGAREIMFDMMKIEGRLGRLGGARQHILREWLTLDLAKKVLPRSSRIFVKAGAYFKPALVIGAAGLALFKGLNGMVDTKETAASPSIRPGRRPIGKPMEKA